MQHVSRGYGGCGNCGGRDKVRQVQGTHCTYRTIRLLYFKTVAFTSTITLRSLTGSAACDTISGLPLVRITVWL